MYNENPSKTLRVKGELQPLFDAHFFFQAMFVIFTFLYCDAVNIRTRLNKREGEFFQYTTILVA